MQTSYRSRCRMLYIEARIRSVQVAVFAFYDPARSRSIFRFAGRPARPAWWSAAAQYSPCQYGADDRTPQRRGEEDKTEGVSEKPGGQQQRSGNEQEQTFNDGKRRRLPQQQLLLHPGERRKPLHPDEKCAEQRGEYHKEYRYPGADPGTDFDQQPDFDERDNEKNQK